MEYVTLFSFRHWQFDSKCRSNSVWRQSLIGAAPWWTISKQRQILAGENLV